MKSSKYCYACIRKTQCKSVAAYPDDETKRLFLERVDELLKENIGVLTSPKVLTIVDREREKYYPKEDFYPELKSFFNQYLLKGEERIRKEIQNAEDPLDMCVRFACAGNYIDVSSVENVNADTLEDVLNYARREKVDQRELNRLKKDLSHAKTLVYLLDNCGEIVLDKLFMEQIRKCYPQIKLYAFVKGGIVVNDASMEDAVEVGLPQLAQIVNTGSFVPGTDLDSISLESKRILKDADVVISKGQANFEALADENFVNPYFLFLVKCNVFRETFHQDIFTSVFRKEDELDHGKATPI